MNLLEASLAVDDDITVSLGSQELVLPPAVLEQRPALRAYDGRSVVLGIRPELLSDPALRDGDSRPETTLRTEVELREALGSEMLLHLRTDARPAITDDTRDVAADVDDAAIEALERQAHHGVLLVAKFDPRTRARVGDAIDAVVDVERLHFFDAETGLAIRGR